GSDAVRARYMFLLSMVTRVLINARVCIRGLEFCQNCRKLLVQKSKFVVIAPIKLPRRFNCFSLSHRVACVLPFQEIKVLGKTGPKRPDLTEISVGPSLFPLGTT